MLRAQPAPLVRKPMQSQARIAMPIGGLNFASNTMDMPITDAYLLDNLIARSNGVEVRKGWKHWVPEEFNFGDEVRTVMAYNDENPTYSKLFCSPAADGRIFDITTPDQAPLLSMTPSDPSINPGEWYETHFHTEAGNFFCVVSAGAGYYTYSVDALGTPAWDERVTGTGAGQIEFPAGDTTTTKDLAFIWTWKSRIWFLKRNSSVAYYLPTGQITGAATAFDFGQQLNRGGALSVGATWTYDSGNGIDDSLMLLSDQGEVLIYQGTDPDNANEFNLKGVWYIGRVPQHRRGWADYGGNLYVLCEFGLVSMADVVAGRLHTSNIAGGLGYKINQALSIQISEQQGDRYWFILPFPTEELVLIGTPIYDPNTALRTQYAMNGINNAWSTLSNFDMLCATIWEGKLIYGVRDGGIKWGFTGYQDGASYVDGDIIGEDITGRMQNAFNDFQTPNANKRMLRIKVYGLLVRAQPMFFARFQPEYVLTEAIDAPPLPAGAAGLWDVGIWDESLWGVGAGSFRTWFGVTGFGKKLSLQLALRGGGRVLATDYEVLYEIGIGL